MNLDKKMQARLDKWRENVLAVKSKEKVSPGSPKVKPREYGDDMREYERREAEAFQSQLHRYGIRR